MIEIECPGCSNESTGLFDKVHRDPPIYQCAICGYLIRLEGVPDDDDKEDFY